MTQPATTHVDFRFSDLLDYNKRSLLTDKKFVLEAVKEEGDCIIPVPNWKLGGRAATFRSWSFVTQKIEVASKACLALALADPSLRADKEVVLAAVTASRGLAFQHADVVLRADKEVVLAAVKLNKHAIQWVSVRSLKGDPEVLMAAARHGSASAALKLVRSLKQHSDWQERKAEQNLAIELLSAFPTLAASSPKVHHQLEASVEHMMRCIYHPVRGLGGKRARDEFEAEDFWTA